MDTDIQAIVQASSIAQDIPELLHSRLAPLPPQQQLAALTNFSEFEIV
jgi:hypothetical protein